MFTLTTIRSGLNRFLTTWVDGIQEGRQIARRYDALARLSKRDLARRGLTHDDIRKISVNGGM